MKLALLQQCGQMERLDRADAFRRRCAQERTSTTVAAGLAPEMLRDLCAVMDADGAVFQCNATVSSTGTVPDQVVLNSLLEGADLASGVFATSQAHLDYPHLELLETHGIGGVMVAHLQEDCRFVFFRKARDQIVSWAGAPDKSIDLKEGLARLTPRRSFEAYRQVVKGTSAPWTPAQIRIAEELTSILAADENVDPIPTGNRQQSGLTDELNHRVCEVLSQIRTLARQTKAHDGAARGRVSVPRAQVSDVAFAQDVGAGPSGGRSSLMQILERESADYPNDRIRISGEDAMIRPDLAPAFALALRGMITKSAKLGALSNDAGQVCCAFRRTREGVAILWVERGGPPVTSPQGKGFGTVLINALVSRELKGRLQIDDHPSGIRAEIALPASALEDHQPCAALEVSTVARSMRPASTECPSLAITACLLMSDKDSMLQDLARLLSDIGFETVETARDVEQTLDKLQWLSPGIAILDIDLCKERAWAPAAQALAERGVPFIFATGSSGTAHLCEEVSTSTVLRLPISEDELRRALSGVSV